MKAFKKLENSPSLTICLKVVILSLVVTILSIKIIIPHYKHNIELLEDLKDDNILNKRVFRI